MASAPPTPPPGWVSRPARPERRSAFTPPQSGLLTRPATGGQESRLEAGVEEAGGRRHARPFLGLEAVAGELRLQGVEDGEDVRDGRTEAHEADAPDLPLEGADAAADLDVVLLEEAAPHRHLIDAVGDADGGERWQAVALLGVEGGPHRLQAGLERTGVAAVT